ncbi:toxin biosynthesis [Phlyctema vagabunda]|uniref:Toxin biosynthesis n=1 Tax=Phlyctema vagabunda TaxID=108571 RepID=A0ABR4PSZ5_9HELO
MDPVEFLSNCSVRSYTIDASFPRFPGTVADTQTKLQLSISEYIVYNATPGTATLVITHATSFNKKLWEPTIARILKTSKVEIKIQRILTLDAVNHGDSYLHNSKKLKNKWHWPDNSRDILAALKYLKVQQPVIGIGHSMGASCICHAGMMDPSAFYAIVSIDPVLFQLFSVGDVMAAKAMKRCDRWENF